MRQKLFILWEKNPMRYISPYFILVYFILYFILCAVNGASRRFNVCSTGHFYLVNVARNTHKMFTIDTYPEQFFKSLILDNSLVGVGKNCDDPKFLHISLLPPPFIPKLLLYSFPPIKTSIISIDGFLFIDFK